MQEPLKNARHEKFAQLIASGKTATQAYKQAGYLAKGHGAETAASRLLRNVEVLSRIDVLRRKTEAKLELSREKLAKHLWKVIFTPISEIGEGSPLVQEITNTTDKEGKTTQRIKCLGKIESARLLCDMQGWKEPEKIINEDGEKRLASARERAKTMFSPLNRLADKPAM